MRIDELVNDKKPKRKAPTNLQDLYAREDDPSDTIHQGLQDLYDPNKRYRPDDSERRK